MKTKRLICLIMAALFIICASSALAAGAGTASDPLISLSYATGTYTQYAVSKARESIDFAMNYIADRALELLGGDTGSFKTHTLRTGGTISLSLGGSVTLLSGTARLTVSSGEVINVSTGKVAPTGSQLAAGNRYLAAEGSSAVVTFLTDGSAALDGGAKVTSAGLAVEFSDVASDYWAHGYISRLSSMGLVNGVGGGKFSPLANITRADFVTILGRLYGVDVTKYVGASFSDVTATMYYAPYVKWASENGIVNGYGDGRFLPTAQISRQDMALMIIRYAAAARISLPDSGSTAKFADDPGIGAYAREAVYAARNAGLVQGREGNVYDPSGNAARAEVCAIICRLIDLG